MGAAVGHWVYWVDPQRRPVLPGVFARLSGDMDLEEWMAASALVEAALA